MLFNIFAKYVENTIIGGLAFLPIVLTSDRAWTSEDTMGYIFLGWLAGWFVKGFLNLGKHMVGKGDE